MIEPGNVQSCSSSKPTYGIGTMKYSISEKLLRRKTYLQRKKQGQPLELPMIRSFCADPIAQSPSPQNEQEPFKLPEFPNAISDYRWHQPQVTKTESCHQLGYSACAEYSSVYCNPYFLHPYLYVPHLESFLSYAKAEPPTCSYSPRANCLALLPSNDPFMGNVLLYENDMNISRQESSSPPRSSLVADVNFSPQHSMESVISVDENERVDINAIVGRGYLGSSRSIISSFDNQPSNSVTNSSTLLTSLLIKSPEKSELNEQSQAKESRKHRRPIPETEKTNAQRLKRIKKGQSSKKFRDKKREREHAAIKQNQFLHIENERLNMQLKFIEFYGTGKEVKDDSSRAPFL